MLIGENETLPLKSKHDQIAHATFIYFNSMCVGIQKRKNKREKLGRCVQNYDIQMIQLCVWAAEEK